MKGFERYNSCETPGITVQTCAGSGFGQYKIIAVLRTSASFARREKFLFLNIYKGRGSFLFRCEFLQQGTGAPGAIWDKKRSQSHHLTQILIGYDDLTVGI